MSAPMTMQQLVDVTKYIFKNNSPASQTIRYTPLVKYFDPHIDCRTHDVYAITFRNFGAPETTFHCANEFREVPESLYERVMTWLTTPTK